MFQFDDVIMENASEIIICEVVAILSRVEEVTAARLIAY